MKRVEELKKVLNFYVKANTLKTKVYDEINNYTVSDFLYGSICLAIAMDSEFKESKNVSKLIRMMILDEFSKNNPDFDIKNELKKGNEFQELIDETRKMDSKDSKLVFKYRMMDFVLTNLIRTKRTLNFDELVEEGINCFNPKTEEEYQKYKNVVRYYLYNSRLKDKNRSGWDINHWNIKSDRIERIAEHIVSTILLAIVIESEIGYNDEKDETRNIDIDEVIKMLSVHEIGETIIGDITPFDGKTPEQKHDIEYKAVQHVIGNLNDKTELLELFSTFESHISNESIFSYFCDKLDADLQSKYYQETNQHRTLDNQETNKVMNLDITKRLISEGAKTPFDIWYAYDKKIYTLKPEYREFADLLTFIRDNNMIREYLQPVIEKVQLTEEEHSFLSDEISKFLEYAKNDPDVEAVTQINISSGEFEKGMIIIDLIVAEHCLYARHQVMVERLTEQFRHLNYTEIPVVFGFQCVSSYLDYPRLSYSKVMKDRLSSSKILLDKTGTITKLKNKGINNQLHNPVYTIEYIPPVEEEIVRKLQK